MSHEERLFLTLRPEFDGIRESVHGLSMTSNEGPPKIDMLQIVLLALKIGNLSNIIAGKN